MNYVDIVRAITHGHYWDYQSPFPASWINPIFRALETIYQGDDNLHRKTLVIHTARFLLSHRILPPDTDSEFMNDVRMTHHTLVASRMQPFYPLRRDSTFSFIRARSRKYSRKRSRR